MKVQDLIQQLQLIPSHYEVAIEDADTDWLLHLMSVTQDDENRLAIVKGSYRHEIVGIR